MNKSRLYIAGHKGMVGSALWRKFSQNENYELIGRDIDELDLTRQVDVEKYFETEKPDQVIVAAAKVGGILANNTYRAEFIYDNLMIEANLIHAAYKYGVKKLIFLGSSCIYPKLAPQPLKEEYLLSDYLEYTNEPYAIAKIAGIKLCENYYKQYGSNFFSVMPTNMYGPFDNFNLETSHVLPALIRKIHEAKIRNSELRIKNQEEVNSVIARRDSDEAIASLQSTNHPVNQPVVIWGTGTPKREFLFVEDLADALYYLMNKIDAKDLYDKNLTHINIGTGEDLSIAELVDNIKNVIGYDGEIVYDSSKPDGTPRKLMDVSRLHELGWKHKTSLEEGIRKTYQWFLNNLESRSK